MKNLKTLVFKITALTVVTLFVNATVYSQESTVDTTRIDTTQMKDKSQAAPQEQKQRTDEFRSETDEFRSQMDDEGIDYSEEFKKADLPKEVTNSLKELYPAHKITDVYRGEDDSYKVKVENKDDKAVVYYNSEGSFLRAKNKSDMEQGSFPQEQGQRTRESQTQGQWGTNPDTQQGTQQGQWGTESKDRGVGSDTPGTKQKKEGQVGTQKKTQNEGSAYPQEQKQKSQDQWGTQDERSTDSDLGTDKSTRTREDRTETQSQSETHMGTQGHHKMHSDSTGTQGQGQYGTSSHDRSMRSGQGSASPQNQMQRTGDGDIDYSEELEEGDLPESVTKSLEELYPAHEIDKIFRGNDDSFKVKVKNQDDETSVYYNSNGDFLRAENLKDKVKKDTNKDW